MPTESITDGGVWFFCFACDVVNLYYKQKCSTHASCASIVPTESITDGGFGFFALLAM